MNKKIAAIGNSLVLLEDLQRSIKKDTIDPSDVLARKLNAFAGSLGPIFEAGRDMDQSSLMEIPVDMLAFLDGEISNPDTYHHHALELAEGAALKLQRRIIYVEGIDKRIEQGVGIIGSAESKSSNSISSVGGGGGGGGGAVTVPIKEEANP